MTDSLKIEDRQITGDVDAGYSSNIVAQEGPLVFLDALDALLEIEGIEAIRWQQYTPYFNDGDSCEFSLGDARVKLSAAFGEIDEDDGDYGDGYLEYYSLYEYGDVGVAPLSYIDANGTPTNSYNWQNNKPNPAYRAWSDAKYADANKIWKLNGQDTAEVAQALRNLNLNKFENVAKANFGDHAIVTFTKDGFDVESYEHD